MLNTVGVYYTAIHKSPRKRGDLCMENKKWGLNPRGREAIENLRRRFSFRAVTVC